MAIVQTKMLTDVRTHTRSGDDVTKVFDVESSSAYVASMLRNLRGAEEAIRTHLRKIAPRMELDQFSTVTIDGSIDISFGKNERHAGIRSIAYNFREKTSFVRSRGDMYFPEVESARYEHSLKGFHTYGQPHGFLGVRLVVDDYCKLDFSMADTPERKASVSIATENLRKALKLKGRFTDEAFLGRMLSIAEANDATPAQHKKFRVAKAAALQS